MIVHQGALTTMLGDLKNDYADLYLDIMLKLDSFNKEVMNNSLK